MAVTLGASTAMLNHRCFTIKSKNMNTHKPTMKPPSLLSLKDLPNSFTSFKPPTSSVTSIPGTILSTLILCDPASSAERIAEGDKRGLAILLPIIPAILWVVYNILGPALNQIDRMRSEKK